LLLDELKKKQTFAYCLSRACSNFEKYGPGPDAKSFTAKKFGFIKPDDGSADVFIQPVLLSEWDSERCAKGKSYQW
jgi:hypothetical protein